MSMAVGVGTELIGTVGFPIAVSVMLYRLYRDERQDRQQERKELREERGAFREAIDGQADAFRALARRIDSTTVDHDLDLRPDGGEHVDGEEGAR